MRRLAATDPKPETNDVGFYMFGDAGEPVEIECPLCGTWWTPEGRTRNRWCSWTCTIRGLTRKQEVAV